MFLFKYICYASTLGGFNRILEKKWQYKRDAGSNKITVILQQEEQPENQRKIMNRSVLHSWSVTFSVQYRLWCSCSQQAFSLQYVKGDFQQHIYIKACRKNN